MRTWPFPEIPTLPFPGPAVALHDTASGSRTTTTPDGAARLYVCGITPYDATHLGHAATYLAFDTLNRAWRDAGLSVAFVQNVTDIDDPLLERAERDGVDWTAIAERDTQLFRDDMTALRVLPPDHYIGAVEAMAEIAELVVTLRDGGWAYDLEGDLYFPVAGAAPVARRRALPGDVMLAHTALGRGGGSGDGGCHKRRRRRDGGRSGNGEGAPAESLR